MTQVEVELEDQTEIKTRDLNQGDFFVYKNSQQPRDLYYCARKHIPAYPPTTKTKMIICNVTRGRCIILQESDKATPVERLKKVVIKGEF